jgi:hypothetical protein
MLQGPGTEHSSTGLLTWTVLWRPSMWTSVSILWTLLATFALLPGLVLHSPKPKPLNDRIRSLSLSLSLSLSRARTRAAHVWQTKFFFVFVLSSLTDPFVPHVQIQMRSADRNIHIFDVRNISAPLKSLQSPLRHQVFSHYNYRSHSHCYLFSIPSLDPPSWH